MNWLEGERNPPRARQRNGLLVLKTPRYCCYLVGVKCPNVVQAAIQAVFRGVAALNAESRAA